MHITKSSAVETANPLPPAGGAIHIRGLRSIKHGHSANITFDTAIASTLEAASRDSVGTAVNYVSSLSALEAHLEGRIPDPAVLTELLRTTPNAVRVHWSSTRSSGTYDTSAVTASQPMTTITFAIRVVVGYAHVELKRPTPLELVITHTGTGGDTAAEALERAVRARFEAGAVAAASFACHTIERLGALVLGMAFDATGAAWASVEVRKPTIAELCDVTLEYASFRVWGARDDPVLARGLDSAAWAARVDGVVPADLGPGNWQETEAQLRGPPPPKLPAERWASKFALLQRRNADERAFAAARCAAEIQARLGRGAGGPLRILDVGTGDGAVLREILRGVAGPDGSRPIVTALEANAELARAAAALLPDAAVLGGEAFTPTWAPPPPPHPPAAAESDGARPYDVALFVQSLYGHGDGTGPLLRRALELADRVVVVHRAGGVLTDVLNSRARLSGVVVEAAHTDLTLRTASLDGDGELHACLSAMTGRDVSGEASAAWARRKLAAPAHGADTLPLPTSVFVLRRAGDDGSTPPAAAANVDQAPVASVRDDCTASAAPTDPAMARLLLAGLAAVPHRVLRGDDELRAALKQRKHKVHALPPSATGASDAAFLGVCSHANLRPNAARNHRTDYGFWRCVFDASPAPKYVTRIARHRGGVLQRVASLFTGAVLL